MKRSDIQIRDPYVLLAGDTYYMYGTGLRLEGQRKRGFPVYTSKDLENWEGPGAAFLAEEDFWGTDDFWAPEVHAYRGSYYLFGTIHSDTRCRGTQIFRAERPEGPFLPISDGPVTPEGWLCLDGTLALDENGAPYMIFCHEWLQVHDGEICLMPLTQDLTAAAGEPVVLFRASSTPWIRPIGPGDYVTDGPFLYRTRDGQLLMLWSSFSEGGYTIGTARSASGSLQGPWTQDEEPVFSRDGGHGMVFQKTDGSLCLTIHSPNSGGMERAIFLPIEERDSKLCMVK